MRRRALLILLIVLGLAAAIVLAVLLRRAAPPEPARLLPPADAFVYLNLKPLRRAGAFAHLPPAKLDPEYDRFVTATGFRFERDLDELALAVHLPSKLDAASSQRPAENRYSEVFAARFDSSRLTAYLKRISAGVETYRNIDVYLIALPGRTLRVAVLGPELVAASNTEGPYVIEGIIDRAKELALPFGGPELLRQHYKDVRFGSFAWAVARTAPLSESQGNSLVVLPGGFNLFIPEKTVLVGSLRYIGALELQVQAFTGSEADATRLTDQLNAFLAVFRTIESNPPPSEVIPGMKEFLNSIRINRDEAQVELTAAAPVDLLRSVVTEPPSLPTPTPTAPPPAPKGKAKAAPKTGEKH